MTTMEAALIAAGLTKETPAPPPEDKECKDCSYRRNDGFCKKIKKHKARRANVCTRFNEKE